MSVNHSPFLDEGIIDFDGPGFLDDYQDEKEDFAPTALEDREVCPPHPGTILRDLYLPRTGVTLTDLAEALKVSRRSVSQIVNASRPVTVDMANRLARAFGTSPKLWLNCKLMWMYGRHYMITARNTNESPLSLVKLPLEFTIVTGEKATFR